VTDAQVTIALTGVVFVAFSVCICIVLRKVDDLLKRVSSLIEQIPD